MEREPGSMCKDTVEKPESEDIPARVEAEVVMKAFKPTLLGLPGEVRNRIYEYVIGGHIVYYMGPHGCTVGRACDYDPSSKEQWTRLFSLSLVCHQLNHEAKNLPYTLNTFIFDFAHKRIKDMIKDDKKKFIATISIYFHHDDNFIWVLPQLEQYTGLKTLFDRESRVYKHPILKEFVKKRGLRYVQCEPDFW
ncbi:exocyst complex component protein [Pyrenophora tritici-repentis]|uniref:Exocyst complex component protein n=1 Tax=Pyrenophora tritici-repentis TaxID=45151 RepID=A0A2W1DTN7_9PLEO|nr:Exocyst complex component protein [Pyrenophora tritici-repentis]KAF7446119.1 Exocyst complex component protein [Pyrenophora tritici-repentis]KAF7567227.1 hypothetical protein PtrM4_138180 [Pyrenophora tritici-repentis]KAG9381825.1 Exocyst complex component protein [Pyrenophora tritici-repentis]KAI0588440.1 Exocyst complex component protein [Pyrenophora tritici-repentis]